LPVFAECESYDSPLRHKDSETHKADSLVNIIQNRLIAFGD